MVPDPLGLMRNRRTSARNPRHPDPMKFFISSADIDPLKGHLLARAPMIKSSHRAEAMARGLGFKSHAALRIALQEGAVACAVDDDEFAAFLRERGGDAVPVDLLLDAVVSIKLGEERTAIEAVLAREPDLSANGFRTYDRRRSTQENADSFLASRSKMLEGPYLAQFARAVGYLGTLEKSKTVSRKATSYGYKHDAERFHEAVDPDGNPYVANGMFIAAALHLGFTVKRDGQSPNAFINIAAPKTLRSRSNLAGSLRGPTKKVAWRNMMVAALNAGLEQGHFGLAAEDNRWGGNHVIYRFGFGGLPAIAYVSDAGFGELSVHVAVNPTDRAEEFVPGYNAGFMVGDAFASGWFERERGAWLQTTSTPTGCIRAALLDRVVATRPEPNGFTDKGRFMM